VRGISAWEFGWQAEFCNCLSEFKHVERHRWQDPRTINAVSDNYHRHDDPSPNNVDLKWLRARATVPN
jgi:hypothetical protein